MPLVSPHSAKNWEAVLDRLDETAKSIENIYREHPKVSAILVVHEDSELRPLPSCFKVLRVGLSPPPVSVFRGDCSETVRADAVKWDKGYKVAHGMIYGKKSGSRFLMSVDADDLLSKDIVKVVDMEPDGCGWYINRGWLLPVGSNWGVLLPDFHNWCGTHAIVRTDLLPLSDTVENMDVDIVKGIYGHHRELIPYLSSRGFPLKPINFNAVVYRVNHSDGNYGRKGLLASVLAPKKLINEPLNFFVWLFRLRYFSKKIKMKFTLCY